MTRKDIPGLTGWALIEEPAGQFAVVAPGGGLILQGFRDAAQATAAARRFAAQGKTTRGTFELVQYGAAIAQGGGE